MGCLMGLSDPRGRQENGQSKASSKPGHVGDPWMPGQQAAASPELLGGVHPSYRLAVRYSSLGLVTSRVLR